MSDYKVDKNIPVPTTRKSCEWDFVRDIQGGESFYIETGEGKAQFSKVSNLRIWARRHNIKIAVRREKTGYRVWRLE